MNAHLMNDQAGRIGRQQTIMRMFLYAGMGLALFSLPLLVSMYRNQLSLQKVQRRTQTFHHPQLWNKVKNQGVHQSRVPAEALGFRRNLLKQHPKLSAHEVQLCQLLRESLTSKEIAGQLNITQASANTARYRLRKKLQLDKNEDLVVYLSKIG
jgi:DNA-binding CsgD family transcriptional regulator